MPVAPNPAIFVNEDISKPENRLNLALLGLMNVPSFREWFVQRLLLPEDSVFYPPQNVVGNLRPDFVVTSPNKEKVYGWIEVELGPENTAQLMAYREQLERRVISIVGSQDSECDLSLQEIAVEIEEWLPELNAQQKISADIMLKLINQKPPKRAYYYDNPKSRIKSLPIMKQFEQFLGDILEFGIPPVPPGKVVITTNTQKGWSLRVFALGALGRSVSLMWAQSL